MLPKNVYKQTRYAAKTAGKKPAILWCKLWHKKTTEITMISVVVYNLYIKDAVSLYKIKTRHSGAPKLSTRLKAPVRF